MGVPEGEVGEGRLGGGNGMGGRIIFTCVTIHVGIIPNRSRYDNTTSSQRCQISIHENRKEECQGREARRGNTAPRSVRCRTVANPRPSLPPSSSSPTVSSAHHRREVHPRLRSSLDSVCLNNILPVYSI